MTYSTNFGNPAIEATNWVSLQTILEQLPDNTGQLISPRDVRDAIFTTWEKGVFKVITLGSENYIGTENGGTVSNYRYKMFLGKKELQVGNTIMDNTLLTSDTDIFIYNNKSDSNLSLQDTKMSFLAGDDFTSFPSAPYIEATKTTGTFSNWIDLNITNPALNGIIEINSSVIELGDSGWIIDNTTGDLYPVNDGQNIGLTGTGNRIGTIFMASKVDYLNDLSFSSGTSSSIVFDTDGRIIANQVEVLDELRFQITATAGYFLSNDGTGNALWAPGRIDTVGVTAGHMSVADGISDVLWKKRLADATGVTQGYILTADSATEPTYKALDDIDVSGSTAGYVLGTNGSKTVWVSNVTGAVGSDGSVQFASGGFLAADATNFNWDNTNKRLGIGTTPTHELDVNGTVNGILGSFSNIESDESNIGSGTFSNSLETTSFKLPTGASNGKFLRSDGSGNATWQDGADGSTGDIQFNNGGAFGSTSSLNWDDSNGVLYLEGDIKADLHKSNSLGQISTSGAGWFRVADFGSDNVRGTSEIVINDPGAFDSNYQGTFIIRASKHVRPGFPTFVDGMISVEHFGGLRISDVRMVRDAFNAVHLEIYTPFAITGFDIYETQTLGKNTMGDVGVHGDSASTIFTGLLPASAGVAAVLDEKKFDQNGMATDVIKSYRNLITLGGRQLGIRRQISTATYQITDHLIELFNDGSVITLNITASINGRVLIVRNLSSIQNAQIKPIGPALDVDGTVIPSVSVYVLTPGQSVTIYFSSTDNKWYNYN